MLAFAKRASQRCSQRASSSKKVYGRRALATSPPNSLADEMKYKGGALKLGHWESITKKIGNKEIEMFAELSEDRNPVHLDAEFAAKTMFKKRIAHGMLSSVLISAVAGMKMPGSGSIYLNQSLSFRKPVYLDDTVTAICVVKAIKESKRIVTMETNIFNQDGALVIEGEALVLAPAHTIGAETE